MVPRKYNRIMVSSFVLILLFGVFSNMLTVKSVVALPSWVKVNNNAKYTYSSYFEGDATPITGERMVQISAVFDDPFDPYFMAREIFMGQETGVWAVYASDGDWTVFLPLGAFAGAITETLTLDGIGDVECYVLPQGFFDSHGNMWVGSAYYCKETGLMVSIIITSGAYYERYILTSYSSGMVVVQASEGDKITQLETKITQQESTITSLQSKVSNLENKVNTLGTVFGMSMETFLILLLIIAIVSLILGLMGISIARKKPLPPPPPP